MKRSIRTVTDFILSIPPNNFSQQPKEIWTMDVLRLMTEVLFSALLIIGCMTILGQFTFSETLPIYVVCTQKLSDAQGKSGASTT